MMEKFQELNGLVVPLDRNNVDTDSIIPSRFLKSVKRTGFGASLFDGWRYLGTVEPGSIHSSRRVNPDFVLNQSRYDGAQILLARENFGCGSSREHAAWALLEYGIRAVIAPSFADIFVGNAFKNGLLPIVLEPSAVDFLFQSVDTRPGYRLNVNLEQQFVATPDRRTFAFEIEPFHKFRLINGLDDVGLVLRRAGEIKAYEELRRNLEPWLFADGSK